MTIIGLPIKYENNSSTWKWLTLGMVAHLVLPVTQTEVFINLPSINYSAGSLSPPSQMAWTVFMPRNFETACVPQCCNRFVRFITTIFHPFPPVCGIAKNPLESLSVSFSNCFEFSGHFWEYCIINMCKRFQVYAHVCPQGAKSSCPSGDWSLVELVFIYLFIYLFIWPILPSIYILQ